jgi:hypothetical protein
MAINAVMSIIIAIHGYFKFDYGHMNIADIITSDFNRVFLSFLSYSVTMIHYTTFPNAVWYLAV